MDMKARRLRIITAELSILIMILFPGVVVAQDAAETLDLQQTIRRALDANLGLQKSRQEIEAAQAAKNSRRTYFFPTLNSQYSYLQRDKPTSTAVGLPNGQVAELITTPEHEYDFVTSFTQPIFTGFALINQYKIASLGLDSAEVNNKLIRQDVILDAKNAYFSVLKTQKLVDVAKDTVTQISAQKEVTENLYQVGMSPLNDLLQSQVQLANAKQQLIVAQNNLDIAKAQFNTVLRRPVDAPVSVQDILNYQIFERDVGWCLKEAEKNRLEIRIADLDIEIAQKGYELAQSNFFPSINLSGNWYKRGTGWDVNGGKGIADPEFWNVQATASWDFWQWGRTRFDTKEKYMRLAQSKTSKQEVLLNIKLEVKQAYLKTKESEQNILTIEKAVEQAKENLRITEERYKEQVSTNTDVLVAQTLLTQTMTNYFNALYDFKIAKAVLYRAIGQEVWE
jgi:outer membrane protein